MRDVSAVVCPFFLLNGGKNGGGDDVVVGRYADYGGRDSIREFCDLSVPIIMFDKHDNFAVMTLGEVSLDSFDGTTAAVFVDIPQLLPLSFGPEALGAPDPARQQPQPGQE